MKKTLIALAAFAAVAAQADVTIYGSVDGGIRNQSAADSKGNATTYVDGNGLVQSNKLGFQGSEAIDGGLKASFRLESNMNIQNGTIGGNETNGSNGGRMFDREAWVKLGDGTNSIGFGKQLSPTFTIYCAFDAIKCLGGSYFATKTSIDQGINVLGKRWDQTVGYEYTSSTLKASVLVANQQDANGAVVGNVPGSTVNRAFGANAVYTPSTDLSVGYGHQVEIASVDGTAATSAANYTGFSTTSLNVATTLGNNAGATYNIYKDAFGVAYTVSPEWKILANMVSQRSGLDSSKLSDTGLGFQYTPSGKIEVAANYQRITENSPNSANDGMHLTQLAGYAKYFFSKTTYVYAEIDRTSWDSGYAGSFANSANLKNQTAVNYPLFFLAANGGSTGSATYPTTLNAVSIGLNKAF